MINSDSKKKLTQHLLKILPPEKDQEVRIRDSYLKILEWVLKLLDPKRKSPLIVGVNGPQGSGKTTLTRALVQIMPELGLRGVTLSIDDFYLTRQEQISLAARHASNPLLQQRGYPGTHDIYLGIKKLKELKGGQEPVCIPIYDKSKHEGQGDRLPEKEWIELRGIWDVVFLEGWMLGFKPVEDTNLAKLVGDRTEPGPLESYQEINQLLSPYEAWHRELDAFIHLIPQEVQYVVDWRVEAEERMKAQGKSGMSKAEITAYIQKFVLAYQIYLPELISHPLVPNKTFQLTLSKDRLPLS